MEDDVYLGDGLYVRDDGFMFILHCKREHGTHWIALEPDVIREFIQYVAEKRNLKITVERAGIKDEA